MSVARLVTCQTETSARGPLRQTLIRVKSNRDVDCLWHRHEIFETIFFKNRISATFSQND